MKPTDEELREKAKEIYSALMHPGPGVYLYQLALLDPICATLRSIRDQAYESGIQESLNQLPWLRQFICKCKSDVCPRVVKLQDEILRKLLPPPSEGTEEK